MVDGSAYLIWHRFYADWLFLMQLSFLSGLGTDTWSALACDPEAGFVISQGSFTCKVNVLTMLMIGRKKLRVF